MQAKGFGLPLRRHFQWVVEFQLRKKAEDTPPPPPPAGTLLETVVQAGLAQTNRIAINDQAALIKAGDAATPPLGHPETGEYDVVWQGQRYVAMEFARGHAYTKIGEWDLSKITIARKPGL